LGYIIFLWLNSIINGEIADLEITAQEFCSSDFADNWVNAGMSLSQLDSACDEIRPIFWLGDVSIYSGIASVIFLVIVFGLSTYSGTNRSRVSTIFSFLVPFSLLFVSISTLVQGGIVTYSLYAIQVNLMGAWYPIVTLGVGLGALIVAFSVIRAALSINRQVTMSQMAIDADEDKYSKLWEFVRDLANKVGAPVPNNIAIGLEPTFYATSANVRVLSSGNDLSGETLYISLPLMRLFSVEEFGAVVGHELGHFKGSDVEYTMKFAPLYRALSTAVNSAADEDRVMAIPALSVLSFLLDRFSKSEREISRQREFEADKVGAYATSQTALCAALIKVTAFSNLWNDLSYDVIENLEYGRPVNNLSKLYASRVAFDTDVEVAGKVVQENLDYKVSHPTDTHPTLSERLKNLSSTDEFSSLDMGFLDDNSLGLITDAESLETELTLVQQKIYQLTGMAQYESKKPDESESPYGVARLIQAAAAVMVCADGEVQPSEIAEAEEKGKKMISHFNSLEFRESCLSPETLPTVDALTELVKKVFNEETVGQLTEFLTSIAAADGNISLEEQAFIESLGH
jgi:Zn-dependent protease with chaperone function